MARASPPLTASLWPPQPQPQPQPQAQVLASVQPPDRPQGYPQPYPQPQSQPVLTASLVGDLPHNGRFPVGRVEDQPPQKPYDTIAEAGAAPEFGSNRGYGGAWGDVSLAGASREGQREYFRNEHMRGDVSRGGLPSWFGKDPSGLPPGRRA